MKSDSKSNTYEFHPKSLQSRDLQKNGRGENELCSPAGASQCGGLRAKPVGIGLLCGFASQRRIWTVAERVGFDVRTVSSPDEGVYKISIALRD